MNLSEIPTACRNGLGSDRPRDCRPLRRLPMGRLPGRDRYVLYATNCFFLAPNDANIILPGHAEGHTEGRTEDTHDEIGGIGAGGPITDHGGVATAGLRYMLLHSGVSVDGAATKKLVLFPAWPCDDWAVDFKLHAPGNTTVGGSYDGAGKLTNFTVLPKERRADVTFAGCVKSVNE